MRGTPPHKLVMNKTRLKNIEKRITITDPERDKLLEFYKQVTTKTGFEKIVSYLKERWGAGYEQR